MPHVFLSQNAQETKFGQARMCQMSLSLHQFLHKCYTVMEDTKVLSVADLTEHVEFKF